MQDELYSAYYGREPVVRNQTFYIWQVIPFLTAFFAYLLPAVSADPAMQMRLMTVLFSAASSVCFYLVARKIIGGGAAKLCALFFSTVPLNVLSARMGSWPETILLFFVVAFLLLWPSSEIAAGIVAGVAVAAKMSFLFFLAPFLLLVLPVARRRWRFAIVFLLIAAGLAIPALPTAGRAPDFILTDAGAIYSHVMARVADAEKGLFFISPNHETDAFARAPLFALGRSFPVSPYAVLAFAGAALLFVLLFLSSGDAGILLPLFLFQTALTFLPISDAVPAHYLPALPALALALFSPAGRGKSPLPAALLILLSAGLIVATHSGYLQEYAGHEGNQFAKKAVYLSENAPGAKVFLSDPSKATALAVYRPAISVGYLSERHDEINMDVIPADWRAKVPAGAAIFVDADVYFRPGAKELFDSLRKDASMRLALEMRGGTGQADYWLFLPTGKAI